MKPELTLRRLYPTGEPLTVEQIVQTLGFPQPNARRPHLLLNMISTVDGRASIQGRSGAIGAEADRQLFHGLRTAVDAVLVGAGTIRAERYRRIVRDEHARQIRLRRGLAEEPLACIVSARLQLPGEIPLFKEAGARIVVITPSRESVSDIDAQIDYVRSPNPPTLDLGAALGELYERFAVRTVLCEGGPHLNSRLLAAGLVDELFLSVGPKLAGDDPAGEALRIVSGLSLNPPVELELVAAFEHDSHLFLRYRVEHS